MPMPAAVHRSEYHGYLEFHEAYSRLGAHFEEFALFIKPAKRCQHHSGRHL